MPRRKPDTLLPLEIEILDVALTLLRSLDYAAGAAHRQHGATVPEEWTATARTAFLDVLANAAGLPPAGVHLLGASAQPVDGGA